MSLADATRENALLWRSRKYARWLLAAAAEGRGAPEAAERQSTAAVPGALMAQAGHSHRPQHAGPTRIASGWARQAQAGLMSGRQAARIGGTGCSGRQPREKPCSHSNSHSLAHLAVTCERRRLETFLQRKVWNLETFLHRTYSTNSITLTQPMPKGIR